MRAALDHDDRLVVGEEHEAARDRGEVAAEGGRGLRGGPRRRGELADACRRRRRPQRVGDALRARVQRRLSRPRRSRADVLPEVGHADPVVGEEHRGGVRERDVAGLEDVAAVGELEAPWSRSARPAGSSCPGRGSS